MSSVPTANLNEAPREPSLTAAFLSYLVPGLGQIYQGRTGKGLLFMVSLLGMFFLGQAMGQWQNVYLPRNDRAALDQRGQLRDMPGSLFVRWHFGGQVWIGVAAWPALFHYFSLEDAQRPEPGTFWQNYQKPPIESKLNQFLVNSDKTPDLGWVYTVVAGMLNILVIYDAYAGPVFLPVRRQTSPEPLAPCAELKKEGAV